MSSSTKSTYPLFESVCVLDGHILNAEYHQKRFLRSYRKFYWQFPVFELFNDIVIPDEYQKGKVKLRIAYGKNNSYHSFEYYSAKKTESLKLVLDNTIDYDLKFTDRNQLDLLYQKRGECDDILIVRNGFVTDSYYANIVFWDGEHWFTPSSCLLEGTKRSQLLEEETIKEMPLQIQDLGKFEGFQLINAMLDFKSNSWLPIKNIRQ